MLPYVVLRKLICCVYLCLHNVSERKYVQHLVSSHKYFTLDILALGTRKIETTSRAGTTSLTCLSVDPLISLPHSIVTNDETLLGPSLGLLVISICSYSRPRESDKAKSPRRVKTNHHNDADKAKDAKEPIKATRVLAWDRHIHTEQTTDQIEGDED